MILRKPYAFLIKYFKIIHIILTLCSIYLVTRVNEMLSYFNNFINGTVGKLGAGELLGEFYVFIFLFSIAICAIIMALMKYKKKSYLFYIILIGYFLATYLLIGYSTDALYQIYVSSIDTKSLLLHRDILRIFSFIQYIFVAMTLVRGLGFDIKKFNFVEDLVELNIDVTDDEEVELTVGGMENIDRKVHRNIRELKYYYLENKPMINLILGVIIFFVMGGIFVNNLFFNRVYKTNDSLTFDNFTYKILDCYVSSIGYDNKIVTSNDNTYVLINMNVINNQTSREINTANFVLEIGDYSYSGGVKTTKFSDLGIVYRDFKIDDSATYLFVFEIPKEKMKDNITLVMGNEKKVKLNPIYLDEVEKGKEYKVNDVVDMSNSFYKMGKLKISSYEIKPSFNYSYTYQVLDKDYVGNITISSINNTVMNLVIDGTYPTRFNDYSFLSKYAKLKYKVGDVEYESRVFENKTPSSYKEGLYLVVDKDIEKADSIWFDIVIRNKRYVYKLK